MTPQVCVAIQETSKPNHQPLLTSYNRIGAQVLLLNQKRHGCRMLRCNPFIYGRATSKSLPHRCIIMEPYHISHKVYLNGVKETGGHGDIVVFPIKECGLGRPTTLSNVPSALGFDAWATYRNCSNFLQEFCKYHSKAWQRIHSIWVAIKATPRSLEIVPRDEDEALNHRCYSSVTLHIRR